jgi:hypothetical protein
VFGDWLTRKEGFFKEMGRGGCNEASEVRKSFVDVAKAGWRHRDRWLPNKIVLPFVSSGRCLMQRLN